MASKTAKKPSKTVAKKTPAKAKPATQLQKPKTVAQLLKEATTVAQLTSILQTQVLNDSDNRLLDERLTAIIEAEEEKLNKKVQPFLDKFSAARKAGTDIANKTKTLKMQLTIPVTISLDVTGCDMDWVADQLCDGWDDVSYEDLQWDAHASIGKLNLSKKQMALLHSTGAIDDVEDTIAACLQNACEQVFDFFPDGQEFMDKLDKFKDEMITQKNNVQEAIDEFQEFVQEAGNASVNCDYYEPYLDLRDYL